MEISSNQKLPDGTKSIRESFRALLREAQFSATMGICVGCGVTAEFQRVTISLFETDETMKVTLPVCRECASSRVSGQRGSGLQ